HKQILLGHRLLLRPLDVTVQPEVSNLGPFSDLPSLFDLQLAPPVLTLEPFEMEPAGLWHKTHGPLRDGGPALVRHYHLQTVQPRPKLHFRPIKILFLPILPE